MFGLVELDKESDDNIGSSLWFSPPMNFCFVLIIPTRFLFLHLQEPEDDSQSRVLSSGLARGPGSNLLFFCHAILFCLTNVKLTVYFSMQ